MAIKRQIQLKILLTADRLLVVGLFYRQGKRFHKALTKKENGVDTQ
ncbi:hypothetical protein Q5741_15030 [Paenibacillus sp. JX-17]|uniref:Uncharacterized protein n=1 Tax=Paenibacillus lacisoli TaxID=3064525 RepID=A0ABT9CJD3_9BACL|nr:hypothetical protein [Paenibacillus sp. JX-17]MDO7907723.1 hypothetical protein [Paenibacillus sp. JX-17]